MGESIVIIGGLEEDADRQAFLVRLRELTGNEIDWEWLWASRDLHYGFRPDEMNKHFGRLEGRLGLAKNAGSAVHIVKLSCLSGKTQSRLYSLCGRFGIDPVLVPHTVRTGDELFAWLFSPAADLVPRRDWFANLQEAALVAILCKLLRNKSWNKDVQGHAWTKEDDLLSQSPVRRRGYEQIGVEAKRMLRSLAGSLLIEKGGSKTPKEWCINLGCLPAVKKAILEGSFNPLRDMHGLAGLVGGIEADANRMYRLDGEVVDEHVRYNCRQLREQPGV